MTRKIMAIFSVALAGIMAGCNGGGIDTNALSSVIGPQAAHGLSALGHGYNALALSEKDENSIGESVGIAITNTDRLDPNEKLQRYVMLLGLTVANASSGAGNDWVFGVIDSPEINAFSGPHGYVFVTSAAIQQMQNEAELAGVLAHEVTHVCNHDGLEQVKAAERAGFVSEGMQAGNAQAQQFAGLADAGVDAITKKGYLQPQETKADQGAVQLLAAAGYDASAYLHFLQRMQAMGAGAGAGHVMSTHPGIPQRIAVVQQALAGVRPGGAILADRFRFNVGP